MNASIPSPLMNTAAWLKALVASLLLWCGVPWTHAQDPTRFLTIAGWRGTFSQDVTLVGSGPVTGSSEVCQADFSYVHRINVSGIEFSNPFTFGTTAYWFSGHQTGNAGTIHERHTLQCPDDPPLTHRGEGATMAGFFSLRLDAATNGYEIVFPGLMVNLSLDGGGSGVDLGVEWGPPAVGRLPTNGQVLSGSLTVPWAEYGRWAVVPLVVDNIEHILRSTSMVVSWNLEPIIEELEVVVEPKGYANWMPQGSLAPPYRSRGKSIPITAKLQKRGGGAPSVQAESFEFQLIYVSRNPGVCMNLPVANPSDEPDLQFEDELNLPKPNTGNVINADRTAIEIVSLNPIGGLLDAEATLSSFDFGAYGELRIVAKIRGRTDPVVGHLKDDNSPIVRIPKTKEGSRIAEAWLKKIGGEAAQLFDDTDQDAFPEGDGHKGDGLTLYEEYRGFSINRTHVRTKPVKKDLFVRNQLSNKDVTGALLQFRQASQLEVHYKLQKDELGPDNVINFNDGWAHNIDQHGLVLIGRQQDKGASEAVNRPGALGNSTPGSKSQIEINPAGPGWGLDVSSGDALQYSDFYAGSVAHELGHGCGIWHHGDCDLRKVVWYSTNNAAMIIERLRSGVERLVTVSHINNFHIDPNTLFTVTLDSGRRIANPYVAVPNGEHSGDTSCIMCYDAATCFLRDTSGKRYLVVRWPTSDSRFCTSPAGTGVNAGGDSWAGNAYQHGADSSKSRGNCAGQICVNDLYVNDPKHDRNYTCPAW